MTANTTSTTQSTLSPLHIPIGTGSGPAFDLGKMGDQRGHITISSQFTGDAFSLMVIEVAPQGGVPPHVHTDEDETFYIAEGRFACQVDGKQFEAGPGDILFSPRQYIHSWICISETPGRLVLIVTPGENFETFFCGMDRCVNLPGSAKDMAVLGAEIGALAHQHGIIMFPPDVTIQNVFENPPEFAPFHLPAGEGLHGDLGDHQAWVKVGAHQSATKFLLAEAQADKNGGVPPHIHHREDETFYILEGRIAFQVGEQYIEAGPGDAVFAPRDIVHSWASISEGGSRLLALMTPGDNFQAFGVAMTGMNIVPSRDMQDPAVVQQFIAIAAHHGIEMLPPAK